MGLWKGGNQYWLDAVVHGHRYRDWREAKRLERQRIEQLEGKATVPTAKSLTYAAMDVSTAIQTYAAERRAQMSKRMTAYWLENPYRPRSSACFASSPRHTASLMDERRTATKPYNCLDLASSGPA